MARTYLNLKPCVDAQGHKFVRGNPPQGDYGYAIIFCERCGHTAHEVRQG